MLAASLVLLLLLFSLGQPVYSQDQSQVDLSEIEKEIEKTAAKPYSLGGFFEFQPITFGVDRDNAFARLKFDLVRSGTIFQQYNLRLRLNGSFKKDIFSVSFTTDTLAQNQFQGWQESTKLLQGLVSLKPNPNLTLEAGNKIFKWGKGYAWSPVDFVDLQKNPEDPTELRQGFTVFTADWNQSFQGALKNAALTTVGLPVYEHVNANYGELNHMNFASKLYLLLYDTDIDFMVATGSSRTTRYGFDFSRNVTPNFEIHGEWALINNFKLNTINAQGVGSTDKFEAISYLLGFRYLTDQETTYILEFYRNGTGVSPSEFEDFITFTNNSYETFRTTGNMSGLMRASNLAEGVYGKPNPMGYYFYFRASQQEPFNILYLTPALTSIINLQDGSLVVIPEVSYSPLTNLELRLRTPVLFGANGTEYGEKQNDFRIEFRLRYFFDTVSILDAIF